MGDGYKVDKSAGSAVIRHILRRKVFLCERLPFSNTTKIVAANIDIIFICMSLNADFSLRRLERYLSVAWDSIATRLLS